MHETRSLSRNFTTVSSASSCASVPIGLSAPHSASKLSCASSTLVPFPRMIATRASGRSPKSGRAGLVAWVGRGTQVILIFKLAVFEDGFNGYGVRPTLLLRTFYSPLDTIVPYSRLLEAAPSLTFCVWSAPPVYASARSPPNDHIHAATRRRSGTLPLPGACGLVFQRLGEPSL